ncbi:DNA translocase FtsK [Ovoidimarina sediminis]|uniref:DNA translocase FtsK n=1 Tax=Ovoidimarina sediminis TaxID=3079856 RepID=UPI00290BDDBA|nr:DNA translocase FtsK 4TM domain-containing protein [Rhodophyticola sp. MJ-SS7]MDU8943800.1 DNA translocase FtsK 4TM domain-containing protein [Rhodophyticola sp. MJ-SS7]
MAYQARTRDPLFDSETQAVLERRARELMGLLMLVAGVVVAMILGSYAPEDPSWLSVTDEPAQNLLGRFGASIASPLFIIAGFGAWGLAAVLIVWGLRFCLHAGSDRAMPRLIFAPIAIALASIYASTLLPTSQWTHSFGLGGLFGDTVLGAVLGVIPIRATIGLKVLSLMVGVGTIAMALYVLGATKTELRGFWRFLLRGSVVAYAAAISALSSTASGGVAVARRAAEARAASRLARDNAMLHLEAQPVAGPPDAFRRSAEAALETPPLGRKGLLARVLGGRAAPEAEETEAFVQAEPAGDDRIRARIADVIRAKGHEPAPTTLRAEPPVRGANTLEVERDLPPMELVDEEAPLAPRPPLFASKRGPEGESRVQHTARKPVQPSSRAKAEVQPALFDEEAASYDLPPLSLLTNPEAIERHHLSDESLEENARMLEAVLDDYGVKGEIVSVRPGPVVTMYELEPAPGLKASRVIGLADDIARSMSALSARVSTVPGRSVIGIELPNEKREKVVLREILSGRDFGDGNHRLPLALGKNIGGDPVVANLAKMPHLLIAGTTGSGKSVAINTMILSLLYKLTPEECRLIMIDPKMLELSVYDGIPHLLSPVVTDPKKAVVALKWVVGEMEERYRKMSKMGVRNIEGYNGRVREALSKGELFKRTVQTGFDDETGEPVFETEEFAPKTMPFIVVIVDEMADLMMVAGKEIEACIQRLAQMARASGIHLIMATQRPSVDVITGTIKANFPTRISFQVTSKVDSRTILGEQGAEQLLGMGDMLYMAGGAKITRVHGPFVSDEEVEEIVNHLKAYGPPEYVGGVVEGPDEEKESDIDLVLGLGGNTDGEDALYDQAVAIVIKDRKCSTSYIQRKLAIGYNKAARLVEQMEDQGVVSPANHVGKREILVPEQG